MVKLTKKQVLGIIGMCILISIIILMLFGFVYNQQVYSGIINDSDYVCMEDYDNINYTVINISRIEFEALACYRQWDWLSGWCSPCGGRNPPICVGHYAVACYNPDSPKEKYFDSRYIEKKEKT